MTFAGGLIGSNSIKSENSQINKNLSNSHLIFIDSPSNKKIEF